MELIHLGEITTDMLSIIDLHRVMPKFQKGRSIQKPQLLNQRLAIHHKSTRDLIGTQCFKTMLLKWLREKMLWLKIVLKQSRMSWLKVRWLN